MPILHCLPTGRQRYGSAATGALCEGVLAFAEPYRNRMVLPIDETTVFREFGPLAGNAVQIGYRNAKIITPPAGFTVDALAI